MRQKALIFVYSFSTLDFVLIKLTEIKHGGYC
jgi:hypothetical protein